MQNLTIKEANWRIIQTDVLKKLVKGYREVAEKFLFDFKKTHTKGNLDNVELDFMLTAEMVHQVFVKAHTQFGIAINIGDRDATTQAHYYIQTLINWHIQANLQLHFLKEYSKIKDLTTLPELIYYVDIRKIN